MTSLSQTRSLMLLKILNLNCIWLSNVLQLRPFQTAIESNSPPCIGTQQYFLENQSQMPHSYHYL